MLNGYCLPDTDITVKLLGGDLQVRYTSDGTVQMTGGVELAYEGETDI